MKIVYIIGPTIMGGATISFKIILEGMIERGCDIVVLVSRQNQNQKFIDYLTSVGCKVELFDGEAYVYPKYSFLKWDNNIVKYPLRFFRKMLHLSSSNKEVLKLIKEHKPNVVHTNIGVLRQGLKACRKLNIPHLWHVREYQTKDFGWTIFPYKSFYVNLLKSTNAICITKDIFDYFNLQDSKTAHVLWDAVLSKSEVIYRHEKQHYFLSANRISPEKRVEDTILAFLAAAPKLPPNYKLLIVGDQHDKAYMDKINGLIASSLFAERIEIRQHQPDVTKLMEDATALVVASQFEGLGRMTLEATFKGCLVLGRNTGGTKEILNNTKGGFLFNSVEELSQQMLRAADIKNTDEYSSIIGYAQKIVVEKCSNEVYNEKIFSLYQAITK